MAKKKMSLNLAPFYEDPLYQKTQQPLFEFGTGLLEGKPNDYYKPIGESGSSEFEKMLALTTRDTQKAVGENLVRRGISRGGLGASIVAKTAADTSTKLRWEDYSRAIAGKQFLMSSGLNTLSDVRGGSLAIGSQKNQYNLSKAELDLSVQKANAAAKQAQNDMWAKLAASAVGIIATGGLGALGLGAAGAAGAAGGMGAATSGALAGSAASSPMASLSSMSEFL